MKKKILLVMAMVFISTGIAKAQIFPTLPDIKRQIQKQQHDEHVKEYNKAQVPKKIEEAKRLILKKLDGPLAGGEDHYLKGLLTDPDVRFAIEKWQSEGGGYDDEVKRIAKEKQEVLDREEKRVQAYRENERLRKEAQEENKRRDREAFQAKLKKYGCKKTIIINEFRANPYEFEGQVIGVYPLVFERMMSRTSASFSSPFDDVGGQVIVTNIPQGTHFTPAPIGAHKAYAPTLIIIGKPKGMIEGTNAFGAVVSAPNLSYIDSWAINIWGN